MWLRVAYPDQIRGCDPDEVQEVLAECPGFAVPGHYVHFLQRLGRGAGRLLRGTDVFYPAAAHASERSARAVTGTVSKISGVDGRLGRRAIYRRSRYLSINDTPPVTRPSTYRHHV
ncbi:MAG TPA: hypothetical protein VFY84_17780 [Jiangellales bacterium]|nr:hypothetical protein [Jiangellales bacterium]